MNITESNSEPKNAIYGEQFYSEFTIFGRKHPKQQRTGYEITLIIASWTGILTFIASLLLYLFE